MGKSADTPTIDGIPKLDSYLGAELVSRAEILLEPRGTTVLGKIKKCSICVYVFKNTLLIRKQANPHESDTLTNKREMRY